MTLKEIYANYKRTLDNAYSDMHSALMERIDADQDMSLSDDEADNLIYDLMLSIVLGEAITHADLVLIQKKAKAYDDIKERYADFDGDHKIIYE